MFRLTITNADGTHYWTEHFTSEEAANKWLAEEETRPYWDRKRTSALAYVGLTPEELSKKESDRAARAAAEKADRDEMKPLKGKSSFTNAERDKILLYLLKQSGD